MNSRLHPNCGECYSATRAGALVKLHLVIGRGLANFGRQTYSGRFLRLPSFKYTSLPPGRGTLDTANQTVAYIIPPAELVYIHTPATRPRIVIVEK